MDREVMHELDDIRLILNRILPLVGFDAIRSTDGCVGEHGRRITWMVHRHSDGKEALLYEDFSSEGQAIAAAIRRGSWG